MKFTAPKSLPQRSDYLSAFLNAIFPDLKQLGFTNTGYGFTKACDYAARSLHLGGEPSEQIFLDEDSDLFRFIYAIGKYSEMTLGIKQNLLQNRNYNRYSDTLYTFCDETNGSLRGWLKQANDSKGINKSFETAVFLTYLLLTRKECKQSATTFFENSLHYAGITDIDEPLKQALFDFAWSKEEHYTKIDGRPFKELNNRAVIMFGITTFTLLECFGSNNPDKNTSVFQKYYQQIEALLQDEIMVTEGLWCAQNMLFQNNRFIDPRSIIMTRKPLIEDLFIFPRFAQNSLPSDAPTLSIKNAKKSKRSLIMAKTGLGKSAYLQMITLCMLSQNLDSDDETRKTMEEFGRNLQVPEGVYVISIPAKMFSSCYRDDRYREWTNDLVTLYFNSMWHLSQGSNFFSNQTPNLQEEQTENSSSAMLRINAAFTQHLQKKAREGKLLVILDSFDEISTGKMRVAYLKALAAFHDKYCFFLNNTDVGAHVIISSREMSPKTMNDLAQSLDIDLLKDTYTILPLSLDQQKELVNKWSKIRFNEQTYVDKMISEITTNHFYQDFSVNPYMLSVLYYNLGLNLAIITQKYIQYLVDRLLRNNRTGDQVEVVLHNIVKILQVIASDTVLSGNPIIYRQRLDRYLRREIDRSELTNEEVDEHIDRLHEILIAEIGLIVPADGNDSDYQFINDQIRFEFAAKGLKEALDDDEKASKFRELNLQSIKDIQEYTGLLVPLLCNINLKNVQLSELLVSDLVLREFSEENDDKILLTAMVDLLLNRYGSSIITVEVAGSSDAVFIHRAQRVLVIRLLSSKNFKPTANERVRIRNSPAYRNNSNWLCDCLNKTLENSDFP